MDLILKNARVVGHEQELADIGIENGKIAAIAPNLPAEGNSLDVGGRLAQRRLHRENEEHEHHVRRGRVLAIEPTQFRLVRRRRLLRLVQEQHPRQCDAEQAAFARQIRVSGDRPLVITAPGGT